MLKINNLKYKNLYMNKSKVIEYIESRLSELNIKPCGDIWPSGDNIRISPHDGKFFKSTVKNRIKMNDNDPRIAKLGREYLESERLSERQFNELTKLFFNELIDLGFVYDLEMYSTLLIKENTIQTFWEKPTSFPYEVK